MYITACRPLTLKLQEARKMSLFVCPLCSEPLERGEKAYLCPKRHCFDIAADGHTYLLPVNRRNSLSPGDDPEMSRARRDFLSAGFYEPLLQALCDAINERTGDSPKILDAGCGDGYYTVGIFRSLCEKGKRPVTAGTDISKHIIRYAAKRDKRIEFAVASSYDLPLADGSLDVLLNCFSPLAVDEFRRVLRPGGYFIYVVPAAYHLWELKTAIYDEPYPNTEKEIPYEGFEYDTVIPVDGKITLPTQKDIQNLFHMTPYSWKTSRSDAQKLSGYESLTTGISFRIHIFRKTGDDISGSV